MKELAIVRDPLYLEHSNGPDHPERPERLLAIDRMLESFPLRGRLEELPARDAGPEEIGWIHERAYVDRLARTAGRERTWLDPDTAAGPRSYAAALRAAGGVLEAVRAVLEGRVRAAFAFVRPPGHHAEADRAMGFCLFNNVAIGAAWALRAGGLKRVLVVDWDVHHGNGTMHAFYSSPSVLVFSIHQYPYYPGTGLAREIGSGAGEGYTVNAPLPGGQTDEDYLYVLHTILAPIARRYSPELILVSAGFDAHRRDPLAGMRLSAEGFGRMAALVRRLAEESGGGRVVLALEGGYDLEALPESASRVLEAFLEAGGPEGPPPGAPDAATRAVARELADRLRPFWPGLGEGG